MVNKNGFLKLVEIQTKVASFFPFIIGLCYSLYRYHEIKWIHTLLFFASMLSIDLATTALNNYMDYRRAKVKEGYNYEVHNAIVAYGLSEKSVKRIIVLLLLFSISSGMLLFLITDFIILFLGALSIGIGILYSFGPIPISRTPFGEIFSGLFMGGFIFFLTVYIQIFDEALFICNYSKNYISVSANLLELFLIGVVAIPMICYIANIMLSNNLSDLEEDIKNERYTLPYYIGKKRSLFLYQVLMYIPFLSVFVAAILRILPWTALIVFFSFLFVHKNTLAFLKKQTKKDTFVLAVKNFLLFSLLYAIGIFLGSLL